MYPEEQIRQFVNVREQAAHEMSHGVQIPPKATLNVASKKPSAQAVQIVGVL